MAPRSQSKKSLKNSSLVPVLFTLGVIGWGFFAIDRLTSSGNAAYVDYKTEAHDFSDNSQKIDKSWKKTTEEFINKFNTPAKIKVKDIIDPETEKWTVINEDENNNFKPIVKSSDHQTNNNDNDDDESYFLYFYQEDKGHLKLSTLSRKNIGSINLQNIFKEIVSGPSNLPNGKHFIDSFPIKPTIIDAYMKDSTLILNLDDNFGHGISFETAELQLEQIRKTSSQFKNVHSVQFLINGEEIESISIDGISIPAKMKTNRPVALSQKPEN